MQYVIRTGRTERGPYDLRTALRTCARLNARGGTWTVRPAALDNRAALVRAEAARHVTPEAIAMRYMIPLSVVLRILARNARKGRPPRKAAPVYGPISAPVYGPGPIMVELPADLEQTVRNTPGHSPAEALICAVYRTTCMRCCLKCQAYGNARGGGKLPAEIRIAMRALEDGAEDGAES